MQRARLTKLAAAMLMALVFTAIMAVPAFAQTYMTDTDGWYTQGAESTYTTTSAVNVTVTIEDKVSSSAAIDYVQIPVSLPAVSTGKAYTVRDALMAINDTANTQYKFLDDKHRPIRSTTEQLEDGTYDTADHYFKYVRYDANATTYTDYGPSGSNVNYDGWCFRINGKMPLESGTASNNPTGSTISNTYLKNNDQINVYFDDLYDGTFEDRFTKIYSVTDDGLTMTVNVKYTYDWFTPISYTWHLNDYANYGNTLPNRITVQLLNPSGSPIASGTTDSDGNVTFVTAALASGTYTIYAVGQTASLLGVQHAQTSDKVTFTLQRGTA